MNSRQKGEKTCFGESTWRGEIDGWVSTKLVINYLRCMLLCLILQTIYISRTLLQLVQDFRGVSSFIPPAAPTPPV